MEETCETRNCGCSEGNCGCGSECRSSCGDFQEVMEQKLIGITMAAHKSVIFDKLVKKIEEKQGEKLDELAEVLVNASIEHHKSQQDASEKHDELRKKLKEIFNQ